MDEQFLELFSIKSNRKDVEAGSILIAEPFLVETEFARAVILILSNDAKGTVGLMLNHRLVGYVSDLVEGLEDVRLPIYKGGPVDKDHLFYLHDCQGITNAQKVMDGLYFGGDFQEIINRYRQGTMTLENIRMYAGYSGWAPRQLTEELNENTWMVGNFHKELLERRSVEDMWKVALSELGERYKIWSNFPMTPLLN